MFFFHYQLSKQLCLRITNYNDNNRIGFNSASYYSKNITEHGKKSLFEDEEIKIIGTRQSISRKFPSIGRNINFSQTQWFSERKPDHDWQYHGQHDSSYYQLQPPT